MNLISEAAKNHNIDRHEYRRILHQGLTEYYTDLYHQYKDKYLQTIETIEHS